MELAMDKSILILGGVLPAVQLLRRVKDHNQEIHIIAQEKEAIISSRYGKKIPYKNNEDCLKVIHSWITNQSNRRNDWVVIPCSEFFIQYLQEFRKNKFDVFASSSEALEIFSDKKEMYTWLNSLGIKTSEFKSLYDTINLTNNQRYIVKRSKTSDNYTPPFKTKIISQYEELEQIRESIPEKYWHSFVIQRLFLNNKSISYGGVWVSGKEIANIVAEQIRQYPLGITSHAVKAINKKDIQIIKETIDKISSQIELHGFIELEFIKNESGLYPIDLNPRLWGWSNFLFHNFPEVPQVVFSKNQASTVKNKNITAWSNVWRDIPAVYKSKTTINSKIQSFYNLFFKTKKDFIVLHDIKPEFNAIIRNKEKRNED